MVFPRSFPLCVALFLMWQGAQAATISEVGASYHYEVIYTGVPTTRAGASFGTVEFSDISGYYHSKSVSQWQEGDGYRFTLSHSMEFEMDSIAELLAQHEFTLTFRASEAFNGLFSHNSPSFFAQEITLNGSMVSQGVHRVQSGLNTVSIRAGMAVAHEHGNFHDVYNMELSLTPIPEAGTFLLFGAGALGLFWRLRRGRRPL